MKRTLALSCFTLIALAAGSLMNDAAHAQISGSYSYDSVKQGYFVTGTSTLSGDISGNDLFLGKDNATNFSTLLTNCSLTITSGAISTQYSAMYPGIHSYGIHSTVMNGGTIKLFSVHDNSIFNISGGDLNSGGGFDNGTFNVSGGIIHLFSGHGNSIINVLAGGSVLNVINRDSSIANISGGGVSNAHSRNTAVSNITGGTVNTCSSFDTGVVNLSGGTITTDAYAVDNSTTNLSSSIVKGIGIGYNNGIFNITGGTINGIKSNDFSIFNVFNGKIGGIRGYNTSKINISGGKTTSCVLYNNSIVNISGGQMTNYLNGRDSGSILFTGGKVYKIECFDNSTSNLMTGGTVDSFLNLKNMSRFGILGGTIKSSTIYDSTFLTIKGTALVQNDVRCYNNSILNLLGGDIKGHIKAYNSSKVYMSGGLVTSISTFGNSQSFVTGGAIGPHTIHVLDDSSIELSGRDLKLTPARDGSDEYGKYRGFILTGTLKDGSVIQGVSLLDYSPAGRFVNTGTFLKYTAVSGKTDSAAEPRSDK
jgi:hypothetical protein